MMEIDVLSCLPGMLILLCEGSDIILSNKKFQQIHITSLGLNDWLIILNHSLCLAMVALG